MIQGDRDIPGNNPPKPLSEKTTKLLDEMESLIRGSGLPEWERDMLLNQVGAYRRGDLDRAREIGEEWVDKSGLDDLPPL